MLTEVDHFNQWNPFEPDHNRISDPDSRLCECIHENGEWFDDPCFFKRNLLCQI